jgi:gamma-glutamyltranspeptidase/glutathione hydrolase
VPEALPFGIPCSKWEAGKLAAIGLLWLASCRTPDPLAQLSTTRLPKEGAVVSEHPLATAVGLDFLARGGNAADAAVAVALTLAVVLPQAGNLGGGGFALWVPAEGEATSLDFREQTPAGYEARMYLDEAGDVVKERSLGTPLAVGIPGSPAGLFELHQSFGSGRFTFKDLLGPAIRLAGEGFPVDPWLANSLRGQWERKGRLTRDPAARRLFFPNGGPLRAGEVLRQPQLKLTLEEFARGGPQVFYQGAVGAAMLRALEAADRRMNGVTQGRGMTPQDLMGYEVKEREPLVGWFRGHQVIGMGPPSSGGLAVLQILGILEGFPLGAEQTSDHEGHVHLTARAMHWWIEAMRCAFADRAQHLGDPDFHSVPVAGLLSPAWIAERRVSIGERAREDVQPLAVALEESAETTHMSVVDSEGNAVSLTTTLNASFGSGILVPEAGFLLNNELDDFSIKPGTPNMFGLVGGQANQLMPGKRPLSSMSPTVVRNGAGQVALVIGAPGGPRIITSVAQVILRVLGYGQSLKEAVGAPRIHQQWVPAKTLLEPEWDAELVESVVGDHGHAVEWAKTWGFGSVQAIHVLPDGSVSAVSDPRRGGVAGVVGKPPTRPARPGK